MTFGRTTSLPRRDAMRWKIAASKHGWLRIELKNNGASIGSCDDGLLGFLAQARPERFDRAFF